VDRHVDNGSAELTFCLTQVVHLLTTFFFLPVQNLQEIVAATLISGLSVGDAASKLINSFVFYRLSEPGRHIFL